LPFAAVVEADPLGSGKKYEIYRVKAVSLPLAWTTSSGAAVAVWGFLTSTSKHKLDSEMT